MATRIHKNEKFVWLKRTPPFAQRAQSKEIEEYFATALNDIGSYWAGMGSTEVGTGMTIRERELLMPHIIDTEPTDREFKKKVSEFFHAITTKVPEAGVKLNIGLEIDNDAPISAENMPLVPSDYVRYMHAFSHPYVVASKEEASGNQIAKFYIWDPSNVTKKSKVELDLQDTAMTMYLEVKADIKKVTRLLKLQGVDPRPLGQEARVERLKLLATGNPQIFIDTVNDKDGETKYMIEMLVDAGVIKHVGSAYLVKDSNEVLGHDLEEAVVAWSKPSNSELVTILKTRLTEANKNNKSKATA